ncbi:NlpC/P60 family protein [Cellulomonas cellasea]|uniref:Cell wall-associated NlpC family hydrolase n=1 Tax=Cellulomonas cellasea TaxID=43670 RepID=A0A7W4YC48_9CELL|nr:C40 family peptidase [Cellulomonas cellasea]MBB2924640.1 cell wall-associated NlpC family hydrolase [Cellulomonas cellasea]
MTHPHPRSSTPQLRRSAAATLAAALLVLTPVAATAVPAAPSDQDVRDARRAVAGAESSVAAIEVRLAQQSAERDAALVRVQQAAEAYTQAQVDAEAAAAAATTAAESHRVAQEQAEGARRTLVAIARQSARSGGSMDTVQAFLSADGFDQVVERSTALTRVSTKADTAVQEYRAAQLVATTLKNRADAAVAAQEEAAEAAQDALAEAKAVQEEADDAVAAAGVEREGLIAQLAAARSTSAEVERARQDALDAERRARENAAAQARRAAPPAAPAAGPAAQAPPAPSSAQAPAAQAPAAPAPAAPAPAAPAPAAPAPAAPAPAPAAPAPAPAAPAPAPAVPAPAPAPSNPYGLGTGRSRGSAGQGEAASAWARTQAGIPYQWGGTGPGGYDCSGLTGGAWRNAGVNLNRTSRDQYKQVLKISYDSLRPGDLVFWSTDPNNPDKIHHVALYVGGGQIMEAAREGVPVRLTSMRWSGTMPYAGRP